MRLPRRSTRFQNWRCCLSVGTREACFDGINLFFAREHDRAVAEALAPASVLDDYEPAANAAIRAELDQLRAYIATLEQHGLIFSGKHPTQPIMQILELPQETHPYFIGTQAHPELTSRPLRPSPMFMGLVKAALEYSDQKKSQPQVA